MHRQTTFRRLARSFASRPQIAKRLLDLTIVLLTAPIWLTAMTALALLVWMTDGRPVFFRQLRSGRDRRPFLIWKLRTMTCEQLENERKPTRLGGWLRLRGLDELPQILNVLAGKMSLVGPRPLSVADAERLVRSYPPFAQRFAVAPGITGLAQVSQARGAQLTARLDLEYARCRSLPLDLVLLIRTAWINMVGKERGSRHWRLMTRAPELGVDDPVRVVSETIRGLITLRRLIPIVLVCGPMLAAQAHLSRPASAVALGFGLCLTFVFVAPVSWRLLLPDGVLDAGSWVRLLLYTAIGVGAVLGFGVAVPKLLGIGVTFLTARVSLAICLALFLVGGWGLGRDIGFEHRLHRERARADALAREAERVQLLALRAQLDPHFLFNTLNSIAEWCREDGVVAERAVLQLSAMLRSVLDGVRSSTWPLRQELELVETLFDLHRLRDPDLFELRRELDETVMDDPVPPLVLLPLAENAAKHGPCAGYRGELVIATRRDGAELVLTLENPGPYSGPRPGSSGLPDLHRRLDLAYDGAATLQIAGAGNRTRVELRVPSSGPVGKVCA